MSTPKNTKEVRVDQFFTGAEARFDRWRSLLQAARHWEAPPRVPRKKELRRPYRLHFKSSGSGRIFLHIRAAHC